MARYPNLTAVEVVEPQVKKTRRRRLTSVFPVTAWTAILTVAAAEAAIGLAILVVLFRNLNTINVSELDRLKG